MGFFKKLINKIKGKKEGSVQDLSSKIEEKNIEKQNEIFVQKADKQEKFDQGLRKSANTLKTAVNEIVKKFKKVDETFYENIEELLISYDVGVVATNKISEAIRDEISYQNVQDPKLIREIIVDKIFTYYIQDTDVNTFLDIKNDRTNIILVMGVNGVGKTTSIAKIAHRFIQKKKKVLLVAGDTFRAGAVEQLKVWAEKLKCEIVLPEKEGQDSASVIYKGIQEAKNKNYDLVICDTSGRLHNKTNLMKELEKIHNVIHKFDNSAPHETLLVLDATLGQSGIMQAKAFKEITKVSGIILTKMDGSSKGGIVLSIKDNFNIPVKYIGLGEKLEDLSPFDLQKFIDGITSAIVI
ncbi:MAG: signal recognition particle-docking protein FtsY [Malacoplasma sp.]|nr:signal recognition particle-docking protein FtsY [Malacoplasma sp.]